jgi:hypothetical protein
VTAAPDGGPTRAVAVRALLYFALWIVVDQSAKPANLVFGLLASAAATWASLKLLPPASGRVRLGQLLMLLPRFLSQCAALGLALASLALSLAAVWGPLQAELIANPLSPKELGNTLTMFALGALLASVLSRRPLFAAARFGDTAPAAMRTAARCAVPRSRWASHSSKRTHSFGAGRPRASHCSRWRRCSAGCCSSGYRNEVSGGIPTGDGVLRHERQEQEGGEDHEVHHALHDVSAARDQRDRRNDKSQDQQRKILRVQPQR